MPDQTQDVGHVIVHGDKDFSCGCTARFSTFDAARKHMTDAHGWPSPVDACPSSGGARYVPDPAPCILPNDHAGWHRNERDNRWE